VVVSEVAKRTGISVKELMMLSPEEVYERKFLDPRFRQELKERAKYSLVVYFNDPAPHCKVFFGEENKKKIKHILEEKAHDNMNAIYGTCASTGKAIGRVQICKNLQEINAFEAGNVLVASMTRPEFLPAMKKSVAIITDEGGITSHAAIVARELGIPCVIGTKNATKILQNGDLVEVRANHGEVIILERAKDSLSGFKKKIELKICDSDSLSSGFNLDELKSSSLSVEHIDCRWLHLEVAAYGFTTPFLGSIVPFETVVACIKGPEMDWITDRSDHKKIFENLLEKDSKDKKFFANLHDDYSSRLKKMFLFYYENMNEDYSKFSDEKLKEKFKEIIERYTKEFVFAAFIDGFMFSADERLNELMKEFALFNKTEESANKLFSILSAPVEDSFLNEVENDLVEIVHQQSKGKKIDGLVRAHAVKYSYINSGYGGYRPYSEKEVLAKLSEKKDSEKSFPSAQNKKQKSALMKKYSFSPEVLQLVRLTELFTKWQDERKQTTQTHVCLEAKLLAVVSKRKNINLDVLLACHYFDLVGLLEGNPLNEKVLKRSKELTLCVFSKGKLVAEVNGKKALDFVSSAKGIKGANIVHIYGMTVYLGKVTGRAKIVRTFEDSKKVQEGDILVIPMTRPEHTPIMKKAAAIVTDDGGITSHAAIVSRELKKPCIVGTKIATHVLKDGDLVEVNANHAQVNILESNRLSGEKNSGFVFYESALDFAKKTEFDIQQAPCPIFLGDFVFEAYAHSRKVINVPYKMSFSFYAFFSCASSCRYAFYFFYMGSFFLQKFFVDEPLKSLSSLFILLF
jgi:phosphohistidine swiveling domain-containing protein